MRIALVTDTYVPQINGVTTVVRRMVDALGAARHNVAMVAPEYPGQQPDTGPDEMRIPSMAFPPYPAIRLSVPAHRRVTHFLDQFQPDLVHVVTEGPLGLVGRRYALKRGMPLVTSYHTHFPRYCREYGVPALEPLAWKWISWFHGPAVMTQTPGAHAVEELRRHGVNQVMLWGRGVDTGLFHHQKRSAVIRHRIGAPDDRAVVLHVGRLAREKNLDVLAAAFLEAHQALGPRARFVIAGEGPGRPRLMAQLPFAVFLGFLPVARLAELYASADCCVLPSVTETCGLVALEAMASALPVVAADAGGLRESVIHGRTGLLADPHDARAFAAGICDLTLDVTMRRRMSAQARLEAVARDSAAEVQELIDCYRGILGRPLESDTWRAAS